MSPEAQGDPLERAALDRFEAAHREDPRSVLVGGVATQWSVHYHERLAHWVQRFDSSASVPLRLAAACQHIRRWRMPRSDYDPGRRGYRKWRSDLADMHARTAREVLVDVGYDEGTVARVEALIRKVDLGRDPEVQLFEDAICMVFFESEYVDLASKHEDEKVVDILRRTWAKMSPKGRDAAVTLSAGLPDRERRLIAEATASSD